MNLKVDPKNKIKLFDDVNKLLSVYTIGRFLEGKPMDNQWRTDMFHDIVALMFYQHVVHRFDTSSFGSEQELVDDIIKTLTIFLVDNMIATNPDAVVDNTTIILTVVAIIIYHKVIRQPLLKTVEYSFSASKKDVECIEDIVENIILLSFNNKPFDSTWFYDTIYKIIATAAFHYLIKPCS